MITTSYSCDRCKKPVAHPKERLWHVALFMQCLPNRAAHGWPPKLEAEWCRACCESFVLLPSSDASTPVAPKEPSLEDVLRGMVDEQVQQALDARGGAS